MNTVAKYFCLLLCCLSANTLQATHIVGGEMNYECLGNDQYRITLQIFRDCETGVPYFDEPASIGVFDENDTLLYDLRVYPMGDDTLDPTLQNPCLVVPPTVCYHTTSYDTIVELPFIQGGYQMAYQRCCRNQSILNIELPLETGATYYSYISEEALLGCNNSAYFNDWPPFFICANFPFEFEHFAVDVDGDSVVYEMCAPFEGATFNIPRPQPPNPPPYDSVIWVTPPYNTENMLNGMLGLPTDVLKINSETGFLEALPNTVGQFVVGICAKEYRNGILISTTRRDFQFNVGTCGLEVVSSFFTPEVQCNSTLEVFFDNQSAGSNDYFWDFGDLNSTTDTSNIFAPTYTYPDTGTYEITLIVGGGGTACTDTFTREINLQYESLDVSFDIEYNSCQDTLLVDFIDISTDSLSSIEEWNWDFGNGLTSTDQYPTIPYDTSGTYTIYLDVVAANGCVGSDSAIVSFGIPYIDLPEFAPICEGETAYELNPDGNPDFFYEWTPITDLSNPNSPNPIATPSQTTTYTAFVSVYNSFDTCTISESVTVVIPPAVSVDAGVDETTCNQNYTLNASGNNAIEYFWSDTADFSNILNPSGSNIITVAPSPDGTTYYVEAFDQYGCSAIDEVVITSSAVNIEAGNIQQICNGNTAMLEVTNLNPAQELTYTWSPTGSILNGANTANPEVAPATTTTYTVTATNAFGCTMTAQAIVSVSSTAPSLSASVDPDTIYAGETVQITATDDPDYTYEWTPSDWLSADDIASPVAMPPETVTYYLEIRDEFGCINTDSVTVYLRRFICDDPYIFVPNAFTPNDDGKNDILYVRANAVTEVYFVVYSRWGEQMFETETLDVGWDGTYKGKKLSPDVYGYYLKVRCLNNEEYIKKGNVTLIR